jgi:myo-inositol-1(or 4)-monophosphatase
VPALPDVDDLLALAVDLARRASALLIEGQASLRADVATKSSATDMVTDMDRASEALVVEGLTSARPDDAILGEEGARRDGRSGVRWVVDPLDGTTNYLYGHPTFAVSIAAQWDGRTVAGVVADPSRDEVFSAATGGGAFRNGERLAVSAVDDLATALVATGFSYSARTRAEQAEVLCRVLPRVRDIRRHGAAALDLCWVACARVDAYWESDVQPWDVAAGALVAEEAGAVVSGLDGPVPERSVLAATPALAGPLRALVTGTG